ncbi:hypothetical protein DSECCO2_568690 [anaerobic digester metagenome]
MDGTSQALVVEAKEILLRTSTASEDDQIHRHNLVEIANPFDQSKRSFIALHECGIHKSIYRETTFEDIHHIL